MKKPLPLDEILSIASEVAVEVVRPRAEQTDREARWPKEAIAALLNRGLGGLVVSAQQGGQGHGLFGLARVCETLANECTSTALCFGMHAVGTAVISAKASPQQQQDFLDPICAGEHITTLSLSEPGTGSHFYFPQTEVRELPNEGAYVINGSKSFVTNGSHADSYVLSAVNPDSPTTSGQFSMLLVPNGSPGMKWASDWDGIGMRGNSSKGVVLDHVKVPRSHLLGNEGDQLWYVFEVVAPYFLIAMTGSYLGLAQAALDAAITHLKARTYAHSGTGLAQVSVLQHKVGSLWAQVERTRALMYKAAQEADAGKPEALAGILSAKAEVGDCVTQVVNEAMTLMGGQAYSKRSKMERLLRDARAAHVMAPTTDILRTWTGRALLGTQILAE